MNTLRLSLKTKWFEKTKAGIKKEDYRDINQYWCTRLLSNLEYLSDLKGIESVGGAKFKQFSHNIMTLGYPNSTDTDRILKLEHKGIEIRTGNPEWGAEPGKLYFVIKHGEILP
jgi:hypothetical protein